MILALNYNFSLNPVDVRNESYQAFIDVNSNNYHDSVDYPTASQALTPTDNTLTDEIKISNLKIGLDYKISSTSENTAGYRTGTGQQPSSLPDSRIQDPRNGCTKKISLFHISKLYVDEG